MKILGVESSWTPKGYNLFGCSVDTETGQTGYLTLSEAMPHAQEIVDRITAAEAGSLLIPDRKTRSNILCDYDQPFAPLHEWVRRTHPVYVIINSHASRSYRETSWSDGGVFSKVRPADIDVLPNHQLGPIVRQFTTENDLADVLGYRLDDANLVRIFSDFFHDDVDKAHVYCYALCYAWHRKQKKDIENARTAREQRDTADQARAAEAEKRTEAIRDETLEKLKRHENCLLRRFSDFFANARRCACRHTAKSQRRSPWQIQV